MFDSASSGVSFRFAETTRQEEVIGTEEHGCDRIDMAKREKFARYFGNFFPEFPVFLTRGHAGAVAQISTNSYTRRSFRSRTRFLW